MTGFLVDGTVMLIDVHALDLVPKKRTGVDTSDFTFYMVYSYWRNALILQ